MFHLSQVMALTLQVSLSSVFHQLPDVAARDGCWGHLWFTKAKEALNVAATGKCSSSC